jgi:acyl-CoA synthetase (AMP-forming)/AMP-acid ligase II
MPTCQILPEILSRRALETPDRPAFGWWGDGKVSSWMTYAELDRRARGVAAILKMSLPRGARVILLHTPGFDYIAAFFGCMYAGVIAVPAYPPDPSRLDRTLPRLQAVVADAEAEAVLTTKATIGVAQMLTKLAPDLASLDWIATDEASTPLVARVEVQPEDVAFLQYTSGSTGSPKGVRVTYANLVANGEDIRKRHGYSEESRMVAWLPPYHDMGLIGSILQPVHTGFVSVLMAPTTFLLRPLRWLECISAVKATSSGGPNFAFDLCVSKVTEAQKATLDLSSWKVAYCGAEPIRHDTLGRFAASFAAAGFAPSAFAPCYGLAEATLMTTATGPGGGVHTTVREEEMRSQTLVASGHSAIEGEVLIVDADSQAVVADGEVGEIWVSGPSVADGYWNRPAESLATFAARTSCGRGPFLRTGDLGFLRDGQLFISGRLKEVMIVRGRKLHPSDLEGSVEAVVWGTAHHRAGGVAVFSVERNGREGVVVGLEVERRRSERRRGDAPSLERRRGADRRKRPHAYRSSGDGSGDQNSLVNSIRAALANEHGVEIEGVILLRPGSIPKTSSGKKQRLALRDRVLAGVDGDQLLVWWREPVASARVA